MAIEEIEEILGLDRRKRSELWEQAFEQLHAEELDMVYIDTSENNYLMRVVTVRRYERSDLLIDTFLRAIQDRDDAFFHNRQGPGPVIVPERFVAKFAQNSQSEDAVGDVRRVLNLDDKTDVKVSDKDYDNNYASMSAFIDKVVALLVALRGAEQEGASHEERKPEQTGEKAAFRTGTGAIDTSKLGSTAQAAKMATARTGDGAKSFEKKLVEQEMRLQEQEIVNKNQKKLREAKKKQQEIDKREIEKQERRADIVKEEVRKKRQS